MNGHRDWGSSEEHQPVTWIRGYPVYAAHLIVLVFVTLMVLVAVLGRSAWSIYNWTGFASELVHTGQVWRVLTYGLFNPPSIPFAIDMVLLLWFGREVEKTLGRRSFFAFYGGIYLSPPIVLTLLGFIRPFELSGLAGTLAVFVGFATLYPGALLMFNILAKWAAIVLVALYSLIHLAERNWVALILLWVTCGVAHLFIKYQQGVFSLPRLPRFRRRPKLRVLPDPVPSKKTTLASSSAREDATMAEVDALLDKIAISGISSLTAKERAKLEAAREGLMKRSAGRG